jgi:hypothetical protein
MDSGHLESVRDVERGKQTWQPLGQHGLARTGRSDHEKVMASGRGDLDCEPAQSLTSDIGQVRPWRLDDRPSRLGYGRPAVVAAQDVDKTP